MSGLLEADTHSQPIQGLYYHFLSINTPFTMLSDVFSRFCSLLCGKIQPFEDPQKHIPAFVLASPHCQKLLNDLTVLNRKVLLEGKETHKILTHYPV